MTRKLWQRIIKFCYFFSFIRFLMTCVRLFFFCLRKKRFVHLSLHISAKKTDWNDTIIGSLIKEKKIQKKENRTECMIFKAIEYEHMVLLTNNNTCTTSPGLTWGACTITTTPWCWWWTKIWKKNIKKWWKELQTRDKALNSRQVECIHHMHKYQDIFHLYFFSVLIK
jgi:hypothetical protein